MKSDAATEYSPWRFYGAICAAVLSISCAAIFFRKAQPTPPLVMAGVRLALASLVLWPIAWFRSRTVVVSPKVFAYGAVAGILYGVHFGTWVSSLMLTSVASSVTLVTATPLVLGIHGVLTGRDRPSSRLWWALATAILGIALIGANDVGLGGDAIWGDLLALLGAIAMAVYLLVSRRLASDMHVWSFAATATSVGSCSMLVTAGLLGLPLLPATHESFLWILAAALIPQLIGHTLLTWAVQYASPTKVGLATLGEPVGAAFLGWVVLAEPVGPLVGIGCAITLVAVGLALVE